MRAGSRSIPTKPPDAYFFYFTDKPTKRTCVLDPRTEAPSSHPLSAILKSLQKSKALEPWQLVNLKRFFPFMLGGMLLGLIGLGVILSYSLLIAPGPR